MDDNLTKHSLRLFHALLSGSDLQQLVEVGAEIMGNPLMVYDLSYKIVAYSKTITSDDPHWVALTTRGRGTYDFYQKIKDLEGFKRLAIADQPVLVEYDFVDYKSLSAKITIDEKSVGYVTTISSIHPFEESDSALLEIFCQTVATVLRKDTDIEHARGMMYEFFMSELLDGQLTTRQAIEERQKYLNLELGKNLSLLTVSANSYAGENAHLPYLMQILETRIPMNRSVLYNNNIVMLISRNKAEPLPEYYLIAVSEFLKDNNLLAGLSRVFHNLAEIVEHYQQSLTAIKLGLRFNPQANIFSYEDYALHHLFDLASGQKKLKTFCNPLVFQLLEYDSNNHTSFSQSLQVYLSSGSDLAKAAQVFQIHRNSMDYRVKKIEEILGIDLVDPELRFSLLLSYKLLEFDHFLSN